MKVYIIFKQKRSRTARGLKYPTHGGGRFYYEANDNQIHAVFSSQEKAREEYSNLVKRDDNSDPLLEAYRFSPPREFNVL